MKALETLLSDERLIWWCRRSCCMGSWPGQGTRFWGAGLNSQCSSQSGPALSHIKPGTAVPTDRTAVECFLVVWQFPPRKWVEHSKSEDPRWFGKGSWSCKQLLHSLQIIIVFIFEYDGWSLYSTLFSVCAYVSIQIDVSICLDTFGSICLFIYLFFEKLTLYICCWECRLWNQAA